MVFEQPIEGASSEFTSLTYHFCLQPKNKKKGENEKLTWLIFEEKNYEADSLLGDQKLRDVDVDDIYEIDNI